MKRTRHLALSLLLVLSAAFSLPAAAEDKSQTINGHRFVDLGLPSGLLWAEGNVGAANPWDNGDFFAWGETRTTDNYIPANCKWHGKDYPAAALRPEDDAATANWGEGCRMPRIEDFQELEAHCDWTWVDNYNGDTGRRGYIVKSKKTGNGNQIFLPAGGLKRKDLHTNSDFNGFYWSSTPASSSTEPQTNREKALCLCFGSGSIYAYSNWLYPRQEGYSVRAVADLYHVRYDYRIRKEGRELWNVKRSFLLPKGAPLPSGVYSGDFVTVLQPPSGKVTGDLVKEIPCEYDGPVEEGKLVWISFDFLENDEFPAKAWLYHPVRYGMPMMTDRREKSLADASGVWFFQGNPIDGFAIRAFGDERPYWLTGGGYYGKDPSIFLYENIPENVYGYFEPVRCEEGEREAFRLRVWNYGQWYVLSRDQGIAVVPTRDPTQIVSNTFKVENTLPAVRMRSVPQASDFYATCYYPFPVRMPEGVTAYGVSAGGDGSLALTPYRDGVIPAHAAALLHATEDFEVVPTLHEKWDYPHADHAVAGNQLLGKLRDEALADPGSVYVLSELDGVVGFYHPKDNKLLAGKAYLPASALGAPAAGSGFPLPGAVATGVVSARGKDAPGDLPVYDLTGRRVAKPQPGGLYLRGGRKYIER